MDTETILKIYAALLIFGGAMGFAKKRSLPSLIAGAGSGVAILQLTQGGVARNKFPLQIITGLLFAGMGVRAAKSGKFMPAGMVALLSAIALGAISS